MKIYTRTGDDGDTSLIGGVKVPKFNIRIEGYGTLDELNSYLGYVACCINDRQSLKILKSIQNQLFAIGSHLASDPSSKMIVPDVRATDIEDLEQEIDRMNESLPELKNFILPGGSRDVAFCHIARCVCRRAERLVVELSRQEQVEPFILKYLNRLSDYLFVLARKIAYESEVNEVIWTGRAK